MTISVSILEKAERWIKLVVGLAILIPIFGYPAIYIQLLRYDLPINAVSYRNILSAGIIPGILFLGFLIYVYKLYKDAQVTTNKGQLNAILFSFCLPFFIVDFCAILFLIFFSLTWLVSKILGVFSYYFTLVQIFNIAFYILILFITVSLIKNYISSRVPRKSLVEDTIKPESKEYIIKKSKEYLIRNYKKIIFSIFYLIPISMIVITLIGYFTLTWIIEIRFPNFLRYYNTFKKLIFFIPLVSCVTYISTMLLVGQKNKILSNNLFQLFNIFLFFLLLFVYSLAWYPEIDSRLGGGKPTHVNVWLKTDDIPKSLSSKSLAISDSVNFKLYQKNLLLFDNGNDLVLVKSDSSWIIIPKNKVAAYERVFDK